MDHWLLADFDGFADGVILRSTLDTQVHSAGRHGEAHSSATDEPDIRPNRNLDGADRDIIASGRISQVNASRSWLTGFRIGYDQLKHGPGGVGGWFGLR